MKSPARVVALILLIVGLLNFAYAGYRHFEGYEGSSMPLFLSGMMCLSLAAVLASRPGKAKD